MKIALMGLQGGNMELAPVGDDPNRIRVQGRCVITNEVWSVVVQADQMAKWKKLLNSSDERPGVEDCFPGLNTAGREWLISGISPTGWKEMFG